MPIDSKYEIAEYLSVTEFKNFIFNVNIQESDARIESFKMQAKLVGTDYIYCIKSELEDKLVPFIYIFDKRGCSSDKQSLAEINKKIWTIGEVPVAMVVYDDEIKIVDTRKPINEKDEANIYESVKVISDKLKSQIFRGRLLEESQTDYVSVSPYETLLNHIERNILKKQKEIGCEIGLLKKLVVKFILIKYLEEQTDETGGNVFQKNYFNQFFDDYVFIERNFCEVLRCGNIITLLQNLDHKFNGSIFKLETESDFDSIKQANFNCIADALDGRVEEIGQIRIWRLYDFNLLPIEFISRLYETFVTSGNKQKSYGAYYTPPHLARLLVDEVLPFDKKIDFENFKILDPTCGSGIFLVLAYKRLITIWMLANNKNSIKGKKDIEAIQSILSTCIYGVDVNADALAITATSLQIELTSHIQPKEIWENLQFKDLEAQGNLQEVGFFKWLKSQNFTYNIILGNPPFEIGNEIIKENIETGKDDDFKILKYIDNNNKRKNFPDRNPALSIFYFCLKNLLASSGELFMVMPASSFLYMPTAENFRQLIFSNWNITKIYDFTPLIDHLWGKNTRVATIAIKAKTLTNNKSVTNHYIIRNSIVNEKGSTFFQIDKYDKFIVPSAQSTQPNYKWKLHLFGGGKLLHLINKLSDNHTIKNFLKLNSGGIYSGFQRDKAAKRKINLRGKNIVVSKSFYKDEIHEITIPDYDDFARIHKDLSIYSPPNVFIRLNLNHNLPIIFNSTQELYFPKGMIGINGEDNAIRQFVSIFKKNRELYDILIIISSSKIFVQQPGSYSIDAQDISNLPINTDKNNLPIPFTKRTNVEEAIFQDTKYISKNFKNILGGLYRRVEHDDLSKYENAFCEILNEIYAIGAFKFRVARRIVEEEYTWITFKHGEKPQVIQTNFTLKNENLFKEILVDKLTNSALSINQVIIYYGEKNRISFVKSSKYKYWMRSIAYRDAENVKADLFTKGY